MTKAETAKLLAYIAVAYPNGKVEPNEPTVNLWAKFTADLPADLARLAVDSKIATSPFPPTIADIRESVARSMAEARGELTAGEAWGKVLAAVRKYGDNDERQVERARDALGDTLWDAVRLIGGWAYLCSTDDDVRPYPRSSSGGTRPRRNRPSTARRCRKPCRNTSRRWGRRRG